MSNNNVKKNNLTPTIEVDNTVKSNRDTPRTSRGRTSRKKFLKMLKRRRSSESEYSSSESGIDSEIENCVLYVNDKKESHLDLNSEGAFANSEGKNYCQSKYDRKRKGSPKKKYKLRSRQNSLINIERIPKREQNLTYVPEEIHLL